MPTILIRTVLLYLLIVVAMKIMGKRQIGQMQLSELVTVTMLSELASYSILDTDIPLAYSIIPVFTLIALEVSVSYFSVKSRIISKLFDGKPSFIIYKGEINQKELTKSRLTMTEVISELRASGVSSVSEVYYMILEPCGKVSVIPKVSEKTITAKDINCKTDEDGIDHALILDGRIINSALTQVGKNRQWLNALLRSKSIADVSSVFYLAINDCDKVTLIKKE